MNIFMYLWRGLSIIIFTANTFKNSPKHITADSGNNKYSRVNWFNINIKLANTIDIFNIGLLGFINFSKTFDIINIAVPTNIIPIKSIPIIYAFIGIWSIPAIKHTTVDISRPSSKKYFWGYAIYPRS